MKHGLGATLSASTALVAARLLPLSSPALVPAALLALGAAALPAKADPITWEGPGADFNTDANWNSGTVPGAAVAPVFGSTGPTSVSTSANTSLAGLVFASGAQLYSLTLGNDMTLNGSVVNNSGLGQTITVSGGRTLFFSGTAASGQGVNYTINGDLIFDDSSSGGNSVFTINGRIGIRDNARTITFGMLSGAGAVENRSANDVTIRVGSLDLSTSFDGNISSPGGGGLTLEKVGDGTLTLTGTNSHTATTITAGTLEIGSDGSLGTGTVTNNAALVFRSSGEVTVGNAITGTGTLTQSGAGTVILTGGNDYSGTTTVTAGTLQIGDGGSSGTLGSGDVTVESGAALSFGRGDTALVVANAISGAGQVRQTGTGTTTLVGALSHTGGTFVDAGTLVLGDTLRAVTLPGDATIAAAGTLTLANGSLGTGTGTITNNGSLGIAGTATAGSATIINDCCLRFTGSATAGTAAITNSALGNIDFDDDSTAGSASISNAGFVRFLANATGGTAAYTGLAGSTVDFSWMSASAATLGSLAGTGAVDLGSITLTVGGNGTSTTFAGVIADGGILGGTGAGLTKVGAGTLTLTGANTYTGLTTISAGTLQVGDGGTTGTLGTGNVVNNAALAFNRSDTVTLTNLVSGTGTLTQAGTGNLIVPGTQAYTGATFVNAGRLSVNGSIVSSSGVTVASGGTLGGTGSLPGVSVLAGGTIAPGNSIGTLSVGGNLTLAPGSTTAMEVEGPLADRINVTGTAALGGTLRLLAQGGSYAFNAPYTLIQAGSVTGNFATVSNQGSFGAGIVSTVTTTATRALLTLTPAPLEPIVTPPVVAPPVVTPPVVTPPPVAKSAPVIGPRGTPNQVSVAVGFDRAVAGGADVQAFFPLYNLPAAGLPRGLDLVSGQVHAVAGEMHAQAASQFLGAMLEPGRAARLGDGADGSGPRYAVWASGFGGALRAGASGDPGTYAATVSGGGVAVGADVRLTAQVVAGVALAGSGAMARLSDGMGRAETNQIQGGAYAKGSFGALRLSAAVAYGGMDVTTRRDVPFLGAGNLRGRYTGNGVSTRIEAGWRMEGIVPRVALTPSVAFQGSWYDMPGFAESGTGGLAPAALAVAGRSQGQSRMELSVRADMALTAALSGFARVGWAAYLQRDAGMTARFVGLANSGFTLGGARPDAHAALLSGGFDWQAGRALTVTARLDTEFSGNAVGVGGTLRMTYAF